MSAPHPLLRMYWTLAASYLNMRIHVILLLIYFVSGCTANKNTVSDPMDKDFRDLTRDEQLKVLGHLSDTVNGDYLQYSGLMRVQDQSGQIRTDSWRFVELNLNKNNLFAIQTRVEEHIEKYDTLELRLLSGVYPKCIGKWTDKGDFIKLHFSTCAATDFLDSLENIGSIQIVDDYTVLLSRGTDEISVMKTSCKRRGAR